MSGLLYTRTAYHLPALCMFPFSDQKNCIKHLMLFQLKRCMYKKYLCITIETDSINLKMAFIFKCLMYRICNFTYFNNICVLQSVAVIRMMQHFLGDAVWFRGLIVSTLHHKIIFPTLYIGNLLLDSQLPI